MSISFLPTLTMEKASWSWSFLCPTNFDIIVKIRSGTRKIGRALGFERGGRKRYVEFHQVFIRRCWHGVDKTLSVNMHYADVRVNRYLPVLLL